QGNPVQTELSLGLVQANLLGMFSDVQGAIDTFFGSGQRTPSVRQTSSCTFRYAPTTSGIHQTLLAEQQRRQRLEREMRALAELEVNLSDLVAQHNALMQARRYGEAMAVAQRARQIAPENPVAVQMGFISQFAYRKQRSGEPVDEKEESLWRQ